VWEHLLTLLAIYSIFELLKGSMSFGGSVFWRMVFAIEMFKYNAVISILM
jgi:hypothetical protein